MSVLLEIKKKKRVEHHCALDAKSEGVNIKPGLGVSSKSHALATAESSW